MHLWAMVEKWGRTWALLIGLAVVIISWFPMVTHPDDYVFSAEGDGLKNYYTYAYHVAFDEDPLEMSGMNFPYGESIFYTDGHPLLAEILRTVGQFWPFVKQHPVGILNVILLIALLFSFPVNFILLRELNVKPLLALVFAVAIGMMAPQIMRLSGHLSLSYALAIPLTWFWAIRTLRYHHLRWTIALTLAITFWLFTHAYLGVMIVFFLFLFYVFQKKWSRIPSILAPLLLFFLSIKTLDHHTDRNDQALGFFQYNAELDDFLLPHHGPVNTLLKNILGLPIKQHYEAFAYPGFFFVLLLLPMIFFAWRKRSFRSERIFHPALKPALLAALVVFLFAMGWPFVFFPKLLDYFPWIKAFRATGRFVWPLFFVYSTYCVVFIQYLYETRSDWKRSWKIAGISFMVIFQIIEGWSAFPSAFAYTDLAKNSLKPKVSYERSPQKYEAIIALPFFHGISESFSRPVNGDVFQHALSLSMRTGLPMFNAYLTRISMTESKSIIQLMSPDFCTKTLHNHFSPETKFLLICTNVQLTMQESILRDRARLIETRPDYNMYEISWGDWMKFSPEKYLTEAENCNNTLYRRHHLPHPGVVYQGGKLDVYVGADMAMEAGKNYVASIWVNNDFPKLLGDNLQLVVEEIDDQSGQVVHKSSELIERAEVIYDHWSVVECRFDKQQTNSTLRVYLEGNQKSMRPLVVKDLMFFEFGTTVVEKMNVPNAVRRNNQIVVLSSPL